MLWVYVFFFEGSSPDDYLDKLRQFSCVGYGVAWGSGFHTMFTPIFVSEFYSKCLTFLVHHFLSFVLTFSDTCLLNFSNGSLTEQTCKNFPRHLNLGIYWPISLTGMKPSFGFCYIGIQLPRHQGDSPPANSPPRNDLATNVLATKRSLLATNHQ